MPDGFTSPPPTIVEDRVYGIVLGLFGAWRPSLGLALPVAERVRAALMHACEATVPWQVSGKDARGQPREHHDHLYILPFSTGAKTGPIDRILLFARLGFEPDTLSAVERLSRRGGWIQVGRRPQLRLEQLRSSQRRDLRELVPARTIGPARVWTSATAFIPPRHGKRRRGELQDRPVQQVAWLSQLVLGRRPDLIEELPDSHARFSGFVRRRHNQRGSRAVQRASGWVMHFAEPIIGPIALGYGAHYGLGRFDAQDRATS